MIYFSLLKIFNFCKFADDNTIYAGRNSKEELIKVLEKESKSVIAGLKRIILSPNKFQAIIMSCDKENKYDLINSIIVSSVDSVALLGIEVDNKLNFEKYIATIISFYVFLSRQYILMYIYCIL